MLPHSSRAVPRHLLSLFGLVFLVGGLAVSACQFPIQVEFEMLTSTTAPVGKAPGHPAVVPDQRIDQLDAPPPATSPKLPTQTPSIPTATFTPRPEPTVTLTRPAVAPADSPPTRIVAPAINLDAPVVEIGWTVNSQKGISEWQPADYAAGFHHGTAFPGRPGNTVISGHHNIKGQVFAGLWNLKPGDEVDLYVGEQIYRYRVEDSFIVPERGVSEEQRQQNARWIAATRDERLTLVTCWPPNGNSHRAIVIAHPVG